MNEPKTIWYDRGKGYGSEDCISEREIEYTSVNKLREFIASENEKLEFSGVVRIDELLEYLNEEK